MDRAEAIKVLQSKLHLDCSVNMAIKELEAREVAIAALREQEQSNANQRNSNASNALEWISVKDRLPEHGDIVLCHTKHDDLLVFQWCEMSHRWVDQYEDYRQDYITHWMPLPEPPKEGAEG